MLKLLFLKKLSERQVFYACLFWFLFIAALCGMPGKDIPHFSFLELLSFDKWVHAGLFFILCIWMLEWNNRNRKLIQFVIAFCILYGGTLEILQQIIFIDRSADWMDFAANSFGVIAGYLFKFKLDR